MKRFKTIGVLGGIGPVATAHFYQVLLTVAQKKYSAVQDADFPHIIINSLPVVGTTEYGVDTNDDVILKQLKRGIKMLENAGAQIIVIPCNSAHGHIEKLQSEVNVPIINLIQEVVARVIKDQRKYVAILSSKIAYEKNLYYTHFQKVNILCYSPNEDLITTCTDLILNIMGGKNPDGHKEKLLKQVREMEKDGVDGIILGCTELPVAIKKEEISSQLFDSIKILADATLEKAFIS